MPITTPTTPAGWSPDIQAFAPDDIVGGALIMATSTVASSEVEGDAVVARVPYVADEEADIVAEGAPIDPSDPDLAEAVIPTAKVSFLLRVSREQWYQRGAAGLLSTSARRAVVARADELYLAEAAPTPPAIGPTGIANAPGTIDGGEVGDDLDELIDLVAELEGNGATPTDIVVAPDVWATLRKLKVGSGSNQNLLGAGTDDAERRLLGIRVRTSPACPAGLGLVLDSAAIVSAVSPLNVAQSEHAYFGSDSVGLRESRGGSVTR